MNNTPRDRLEAAAHDAESNLHAHLRAATVAANNPADQAVPWREESPPAADVVAARAGELARRTGRWLRDGSERAREQIAVASDRTMGYVRQEPARAVLMAAAAGALLFALARSFSSRSR
jgi:ElaB/YqjD/DUF883 family membrane-anchored ribosome-binding protein